jgi:cell division FtsZ-interacting protein ZapD
MSVQNYTGTASYSWQNSGAQATINQSATLTSGTATVVLLDANGTQVYSSSLSNNGTFQSNVGVAGMWTVRVSYDVATSPAINFRVQKL